MHRGRRGQPDTSADVILLELSLVVFLCSVLTERIRCYVLLYVRCGPDPIFLISDGKPSGCFQVSVYLRNRFLYRRSCRLTRHKIVIQDFLFTVFLCYAPFSDYHGETNDGCVSPRFDQHPRGEDCTGYSIFPQLALQHSPIIRSMHPFGSLKSRSTQSDTPNP